MYGVLFFKTIDNNRDDYQLKHCVSNGTYTSLHTICDDEKINKQICLVTLYYMKNNLYYFNYLLIL